MGKFQAISGLHLDAYSKRVIHRISEKRNFNKLLEGAKSIGVFSHIFTKSGPKTTMYHISQADWELYTKAIQGTQIPTDSTIRKEIRYAYAHYQSPNKHDYKITLFWKNMLNGIQ